MSDPVRRICLTFFQVWSVRERIFGFSPPAELSGWLSAFEIFNFNLGAFIFPDWKCVGGMTTRLAFLGLWPIALMIAVAFAFLAREVWCRGSVRQMKAGQAIDTTGDGKAVSIAVDTDGDGGVDKLVKLSKKFTSLKTMDTMGDGMLKASL